MAPPLKQVARAWSRRLAAAQTIAVVDEGGRTVSLGSILGPEFAAAPALLFGPDQFHPSAAGYRSLVQVLLPSTLAALGLVPRTRRSRTSSGEGVLPITDAAIQAVKVPAPRSTAPTWAAAGCGVRGLWVELRHRRRQPTTTAEAPEDVEASVPQG